MSYPARAEGLVNRITHECKTMVGKGQQSGTHSDLLHSRMRYDKTAIEKIIDMINCIFNPFDYN